MTSWALGDYPRMARRLVPVALEAVTRAGVTSADRVLDVATGTGNAALLAAGRGATAVGIDAEPALLAVARLRARDAGRAVSWIHADLAAIPVADRSADVVLSVFGVMYAEDHARAAEELARVCAPDARLVLASWVPGSALPAMGTVLGRYLPPPPPATGPPSRWGDAAALEDLLRLAGLRPVDNVTGRLDLDFASPRDCTDFLIRTAGHVMAEREDLIRADRWSGLNADLRAYVTERGHQVDGHFRLPLDYLLTAATRAR